MDSGLRSKAALVLIVLIAACADISQTGVTFLQCGTSCLEEYQHNTTHELMTSVAIGELTGDGTDDVVGTTRKGGEIANSTVYLWTKSGGSWEKSVLIQANFSDIPTIAVGDADNDGDDDIVMWTLGDEGYPNVLNFYYKEGGLWLNKTINGSTMLNVESIKIGDADNDGRNEVIVGAGTMFQSSDYARLQVYEYSGAWSMAADVNVSGENAVSALAIGDLDGDGENEILAGTEDGEGNPPLGGYDFTGEIWLYEWDGGLSGTLINETSSVSVLDLEIGDYDHDGENEFAAFLANPHGVQIYDFVEGSWQAVFWKDSDCPECELRTANIVSGDINNS